MKLRGVWFSTSSLTIDSDSSLVKRLTVNCLSRDLAATRDPAAIARRDRYFILAGVDELIRWQFWWY